MTKNRPTNLGERLAGVPPSEWILEMRRHYQQTGRYRVEDVRRVLGDANRSSELRRRVENAAQNAARK